jgi:hypothetical protein
LRARAAAPRRGTRFRLFAQLPVLEAFREPETVWISSPAGTVAPGPQDDRVYVVDPLRKVRPYEYPYLPPYAGPTHPAAVPGADGHFDHLDPEAPGFRAAHMFGTVRRVLDVWERYCGGRIEWHFRDTFRRLELVPYVEWENAHAGFGFIETGYGSDERGGRHLHCLNFDVLAHELGHILLYSLVGAPARGAETAEYFGFHECGADLVALVTVLHFHTVLDHVLERSHGNLFNLTELSRIGELSETTQIRIADNTLRMSDVPDVATPVELLCQPERHQLSQPLTGAVFDALVDVYQARLVEAGLITEDLDRRSGRVTGSVVDDPEVHARFAAAYGACPEGFRAVLTEVRDYVGICLARSWRALSADHLSYTAVANALLAADWDLSGGRYFDTIRESFAWREIGTPPSGRAMAGGTVHGRRRASR